MFAPTVPWTCRAHRSLPETNQTKAWARVALRAPTDQSRQLSNINTRKISHSIRAKSCGPTNDPYMSLQIVHLEDQEHCISAYQLPRKHLIRLALDLIRELDPSFENFELFALNEIRDRLHSASGEPSESQ